MFSAFGFFPAEVQFFFPVSEASWDSVTAWAPVRFRHAPLVPSASASSLEEELSRGPQFSGLYLSMVQAPHKTGIRKLMLVTKQSPGMACGLALALEFLRLHARRGGSIRKQGVKQKGQEAQEWTGPGMPGRGLGLLDGASGRLDGAWDAWMGPGMPGWGLGTPLALPAPSTRFVPFLGVRLSSSQQSHGTALSEDGTQPGRVDRGNQFPSVARGGCQHVCV